MSTLIEHHLYIGRHFTEETAWVAAESMPEPVQIHPHDLDEPCVGRSCGMVANQTAASAA